MVVIIKAEVAAAVAAVVVIVVVVVDDDVVTAGDAVVTVVGVSVGGLLVAVSAEVFDGIVWLVTVSVTGRDELSVNVKPDVNKFEEDPCSKCSGFEADPKPEMTFWLKPEIDPTTSLQYSGVL